MSLTVKPFRAFRPQAKRVKEVVLPTFDNLTEKQLNKILKESDNGFYIADQDLRLRGFGDIIGYQQSGEKFFKIANPSIHEDLFKNAENYIKKIENENLPLTKYNELLKIFDKVEIIL